MEQKSSAVNALTGGIVHLFKQNKVLFCTTVAAAAFEFCLIFQSVFHGSSRFVRVPRETVLLRIVHEGVFMGALPVTITVAPRQ